MNTSKEPCVVLLSGLLCDAALWRTPITQLNQWCKITVADLTKDNSIAGMAKRVLAAAPECFMLVGFSMGGYVAFEMMRQAPNRVKKLALFNTKASLDSPERLAQRERSILLATQGNFIGISPQLLPRLIYKDKLNTPVANEIMEMGVRVGKDTFIRQQQAIIKRVDSTSTLASIHIPTMVVAGDDDQLSPIFEAKKIANGIYGAQLHILPYCGHLSLLEQPEQTTSLLKKWLFS